MVFLSFPSAVSVHDALILKARLPKTYEFDWKFDLDRKVLICHVSFFCFEKGKRLPRCISKGNRG